MNPKSWSLPLGRIAVIALITGIAVIAGIAGLAIWLPVATPADETAPPAAVVDVVPAVRESVPRQIEGAGGIVARAEQSLSLQSAAILIAYDIAPGMAVSAGQALAELAPDPGEASNLAKAENAEAAARASRERIAALLPAHLATAADLAAADQSLRDAAASLRALRVTGAGQRLTLRAAAAGIVTALGAMPGSSLPAGTQLLRFVPADALIAQIGLMQSAAAPVQPGDPAQLVPLNGGGSVAARVVSVAAALDPQTGLIEVTLRPEAPVALGAPVAATIDAGRLDGYPVPNAAVLRDEAGTYVFQLDPKGVAHRQNVAVLQQDATTSVLAPGLNPGWRIATTGAYQLSDGMAASVPGAGR